MALTQTNQFTLPVTIAGRRRKRRNRAAIVVAVLLVAAAIVVPLSLSRNSSCAQGIANVGGECIGVTAGDFAFNPDDAQFSKVENLIRTLNQQAVASDPNYVNVALLTSLTWTATSALSRAKIIHQLEGAAIALDRVNNHGVTGDAPKIELLLANEGTDEDQYGTVISQLVGMTRGDHPLDAVIGMGVSSGATLTGATELSQAGVLMVGSNVTGDILDSSQIPGFSRVSTPNSDDVAAMANYLAGQSNLHRAMLVHAAADPRTSSGDRADYYTTSLAKDFSSELGRYATAPSEPFDPGDTNNSFSVISTNLCTTANPPDVILYAGREPDLPQFIHDLAQRPCVGTPITLVVGTDSSSLESDTENQAQTRQIDADLTAGNITVLCPAWVAPQDWATPSGAKDAPAGFAAFMTEFDQRFTANGQFGTELDDGYAIMSHDALLTAAKAIRLTTQPPMKFPTPEQVLGNQYHMDAGNTVPGASGTLTFVEADNGNPGGKPVFVVRLEPSGPPTLLTMYLAR